MRCIECLKEFNEKSSIEEISPEASCCFLHVRMARQRKAVMEWWRQRDCFGSTRSRRYAGGWKMYHRARYSNDETGI